MPLHAIPTAIDCGLQAYFAAMAATRSRDLVNALSPGTLCAVGFGFGCYSLIDPYERPINRHCMLYFGVPIVMFLVSLKRLVKVARKLNVNRSLRMIEKLRLY